MGEITAAYAEVTNVDFFGVSGKIQANSMQCLVGSVFLEKNKTALAGDSMPVRLVP